MVHWEGVAPGRARDFSSQHKPGLEITRQQPGACAQVRSGSGFLRHHTSTIPQVIHWAVVVPDRARDFTLPRWGGVDLNSSNRGCARLGSEVAPPLGMVIEKVAVLIVLVRRHRRAVGAAVRRAVDDEVPGAVEEETGLATVRRVPSGILDTRDFSSQLLARRSPGSSPALVPRCFLDFGVTGG